MKNTVSYYSIFRKLIFILFILFVTLFTISAGVNAQGRHGSSGRSGGRSFTLFSHRSYGFGGFHHGYHFFPRIGARFNILPFGYTAFWLDGLEYFYCNGNYYQYYPADRVYVVVNKPAGADKVSNLKFDQVHLYDGSTLEGIFESATDSTVTLKIGDKNHDININDIVSINFAPSVQDSIRQK
jgi:hypothetical protein